MATKNKSTKKATKSKATKAAKPKAKAGRTHRSARPKAKANGKAKRVSAVDAAIRVLAEVKKPMNCKALVEAMVAKKLWSSPNGKTPHATLYSAILRDIRKGKDAQFKKVERGMFTLAKKGA
jgi:hypothetical protein